MHTLKSTKPKFLAENLLPDRLLSSSPNNITVLPNEVLKQVFQHLPWKDQMLSIGLVCSNWSDLSLIKRRTVYIDKICMNDNFAEKTAQRLGVNLRGVYFEKTSPDNGQYQEVHAEILRPFADHCPNVTQIDCGQLSQEAFQILPEFRNLRKLRIFGGQEILSTENERNALSNLPQLEELRVMFFDGNIRNLRLHNPQLLRSISGVYYQYQDVVIRTCPNLRTLRAMNHKYFSSCMADFLMAARHDVAFKRISDEYDRFVSNLDRIDWILLYVIQRRREVLYSDFPNLRHLGMRACLMLSDPIPVIDPSHTIIDPSHPIGGVFGRLPYLISLNLECLQENLHESTTVWSILQEIHSLRRLEICGGVVTGNQQLETNQMLACVNLQELRVDSVKAGHFFTKKLMDAGANQLAKIFAPANSALIEMLNYFGQLESMELHDLDKKMTKEIFELQWPKLQRLVLKAKSIVPLELTESLGSTVPKLQSLKMYDYALTCNSLKILLQSDHLRDLEFSNVEIIIDPEIWGLIGASPFLRSFKWSENEKISKKKKNYKIFSSGGGYDALLQSREKLRLN